jgi:hypothetical protein
MEDLKLKKAQRLDMEWHLEDLAKAELDYEQIKMLRQHFPNESSGDLSPQKTLEDFGFTVNTPIKRHVTWMNSEEFWDAYRGNKGKVIEAGYERIVSQRRESDDCLF